MGDEVEVVTPPLQDHGGFFCQAEAGIRDYKVTGVQTCALPILALLQVGGHPSKESAELLEQVRNIDVPLHFETYYSLSCHNCPDVVQALNLMSVLNPKISHTAIDGGLFQKEVEQREVMGVPTVFVNGERFGQGRMELAEIVAKVDTGAASREAAKISAKDAFDVLIVGGGPAGAAAAIYAARKGIRTGIAAERLDRKSTRLNSSHLVISYAV